MAIKVQKKLKNCANCGKAFVATRNEKLCRDCTIQEEEKERGVLQYVRDHQGVTIAEVIEATGVSEKLIKKMVREGLFVNIEREDFYYPCVSCGRPIRKGTYCSDCLSRLRKETQRAAEQMSVKVKAQKQLSKLSTLDRLNALAEKEFESENNSIKRRFSRNMYERIVNSRDKQ